MTNIKQRAREMLQNINTILEKIKLNEWKKEGICMQKCEVYDATTQSWTVTGQKYCDELQVELDQIIDMAIAEERGRIMEMLQKEKSTWANQSIGYKAVESVEIAFNELNNTK